MGVTNQLLTGMILQVPPMPTPPFEYKGLIGLMKAQWLLIIPSEGLMSLGLGTMCLGT